MVAQQPAAADTPSTKPMGAPAAAGADSHALPGLCERISPLPPSMPHTHRRPQGSPSAAPFASPLARSLSAASDGTQASSAASAATPASGKSKRGRPPPLSLAAKAAGLSAVSDSDVSDQLGSRRQHASSKGASTAGSSAGCSGPPSGLNSASSTYVHAQALIAVAAATAASAPSAAAECLSSPQLPQEPGSCLELQSIDGLKRLQKLGQGASGTVEKHQHLKTGKVIALKIIPAADVSEHQRKSLFLEVRTFAKCQNPHIVQFYGAFLHENRIHIALEFMDGGALSDIIEVRRIVPEPQLAIITWQVLDGLEYLHGEMKVIHRDIKPSNLLFSLQGVVKITDFGVSGEITDELAQSNKQTWVGTIHYMSPERVVGQPYKYDSDVWSLGLTLIECLTGCYPYATEEKSCKRAFSVWDLMKRIVDDDPPGLPPDAQHGGQLRSFLDAVLQKEPKQRPSATTLKGHAWLEGSMSELSQQELAEWISDPEEKAAAALAAEALLTGGSETPDRKLPGSPLAASVRTGGNLFCRGQAGGAAEMSSSLGSSTHHAGNPFTSTASGEEPGAAAGSCMGASVRGGGFCMGASVRGGGNPFAGFKPSDRAEAFSGPSTTAGLRAFSPLKRSPEPTSGHGSTQTSITILSTSSREATEPASVLCDRLRSALACRLEASAGVSAPEDENYDLRDAEFESWEARVHSIASAFSPDFTDSDESVRLTPGAAAKASRARPLEDGIHLGDARSAQADALASLGLSAVLNCGARAVEYPADILHLEVQCEDVEGYPLLARHLDECLAFIESCEAERRELLLHCVMGLNRSAAVAVAFLMLNRRVPLLEAVHRVWKTRGGLPILTNRSFRQDLVCLAHISGRLA